MGAAAVAATFRDFTFWQRGHATFSLIQESGVARFIFSKQAGLIIVVLFNVVKSDFHILFCSFHSQNKFFCCTIQGMEIKIAVAKIKKYAVSESGDTFEVTERPNGGLSVVLADGQTSGRGAKAISMMVVRRVIGLLAEGVRDGAAARAASDYLYTEKKGKVSSTLNIASIDLKTKTVVLSRNNPAPTYICHGDHLDVLKTDSSPIGIARNIRPSISEIALEPGLTIVIYTDGLTHAGKRTGQAMDISSAIQAMLDDQENPSPQEIADSLLAHAVRLDDNRPVDDISVVVMRVTSEEGDNVRRMSVEVPLGAV